MLAIIVSLASLHPILHFVLLVGIALLEVAVPLLLFLAKAALSALTRLPLVSRLPQNAQHAPLASTVGRPV